MVQGGWFLPSGCLSLRSVIVENSSGQNNCTSASELLKPVKKRKHREYQSPSENESEPEAMVGSGQLGGQGEVVPQFSPLPPLIQVVGLGHRRHIITHSLYFWVLSGVRSCTWFQGNKQTTFLFF